MRVLLISPTFPPRKFGGITQASYDLAKHLSQRGNKVSVYTTDLNNRNSRIHDTMRVQNVSGMGVLYFRNLSNSLASKRIYLPQGLNSMMKRAINNFDVIHINDFGTLLNIVAHHYANKNHIPYVLQAHGSLPIIIGKQRLKQIYDSLWGQSILKDASRVIAVSEMEAKQYESMGVNQDKIVIIPNGINVSEFDNLPPKGEFKKRWNIPGGQKIILFLARINRIKGPDLLAKAFTAISEDAENLKLVMAGPDDGYLAELKRVVRELKIEEKVVFTGPLYGRAKLEAYVDAAVYVLPSSYEIFGISVLEAMACGTPVIVTDRCGIANVIKGQAGLVVPYDEDRLLDALLSMLNNDEIRLGFGDKGRLLARDKFNWEKLTEQVEEVYGEVVKV